MSRSSRVMRRLARAAYVEALRDGRRERAVTFTDRKREASRRGARGRSWRTNGE